MFKIILGWVKKGRVRVTWVATSDLQAAQRPWAVCSDGRVRGECTTSPLLPTATTSDTHPLHSKLQRNPPALDRYSHIIPSTGLLTSDSGPFTSMLPPNTCAAGTARQVTQTLFFVIALNFYFKQLENIDSTRDFGLDMTIHRRKTKRNNKRQPPRFDQLCDQVCVHDVSSGYRRQNKSINTSAIYCSLF